ncbi:MAG TPA: DPP IV N-terminal domain-containing protein [Fimbriimonadaceae bacterium]|nr:DPP IV N-terminal domain-containing protein [Fimbriimonadaceae bacterium]
MRRAVLALIPLLAATSYAQDRLPHMPRYDRYEKLRREIFGSVVRGDLSVRWADDSHSFTFFQDGKRLRYDLKTSTEAEDSSSADAGPATQGRGRRGGGQRGTPARGRQFTTALSADGKMKAECKDRNVVVSDADGHNEVQITTDGSFEKRLKNGTGSWVYGEELGQREAMWWSPDDKKLAYFHFDESKVPDYYLQMEQVQIQDKLDTEAYPKAGAPNPIVDAYIYDVATKRTVHADAHFGDPSLGEYVYDVRWSNDGKELWFNRTNRRQNILEWVGCDPATGKCHTIYREENPNGWVDNHLDLTWLDGNKQFLLISEKNGIRNIYLHNADGSLVRQVTNYDFEVGEILKADAKEIWYTARDGDTPYKLQLHRIGIDGRGDVRLTDPSLNHRIQLAPDGQSFVDVAQSLSVPPRTVLRDHDGKEIKILAESDLSKFDSLSLRKSEQFTFTAADGKTKCYGYLQFPSDFDPNEKYPLLVSVYGGPESGMGQETFQTPNPITEMGFLHCWIDGRGTSGRGRAFRQAGYLHLGIVEIDDQAAGVRELAKRPYVDGSRVGIYGTSYGGYASLMCLLRYPDVFAAASASSPVTDWRNYDSIYTERYMWIPQENKEGYDAGSAMNYVKDIKGRLLLYWGTSDNNVHPSNSLQLVQALAARGKSFDIMVGPDQGHSGVNSSRMWEFFVDNLILSSAKEPLKLAWNKRAYRRR